MTFLNMTLNFKNDITLFYNFFSFKYMKLSKSSSAKCSQESKEILQKKLVKDIKIFLKKKKNKIRKMVVNVKKVSQKIL